MHDLLDWRGDALAGHLLDYVRSEVVVAGTHGVSLQRPVQFRASPRPVDAQIRRWRRCWRSGRGSLEVLHEPLQVVSGNACLDCHVVQLILERSLLDHAPLISLERVSESRLNALKQWAVDEFRREALHRDGEDALLARGIFICEVEYLLVMGLPDQALRCHVSF